MSCGLYTHTLSHLHIDIDDGDDNEITKYIIIKNIDQEGKRPETIIKLNIKHKEAKEKN